METSTKEQRLTEAKAIQYLESRTEVTTPGAYKTKIIGDPFLYKGKYICNLQLLDVARDAEINELLDAGRYDDAANVGMTFNVFADSALASQAVRGAHVVAHVDYWTSEDGTTTKLVVTDMTVPGAITAPKAKGRFASRLQPED